MNQSYHYGHKSKQRIITEEAISRSIDTADRKDPEWSDRCFELLKKYIKNRKTSFMCEAFREYCKGKIEMPDNLKAFGGVILRAAYSGIIIKQSIGSVKTPSSHMANAGVWVATGK